MSREQIKLIKEMQQNCIKQADYVDVKAMDKYNALTHLIHQNEKYKKVIGNVSEFINEYRKHRNVFKWNEQDYIDVIGKIDELLKEVE